MRIARHPLNSPQSPILEVLKTSRGLLCLRCCSSLLQTLFFCSWSNDSLAGTVEQNYRYLIISCLISSLRVRRENIILGSLKPIYPPVLDPPVYLVVYRSRFCLCVCLFVYLSLFCLFVSLSLSLSGLSVCLSICLSLSLICFCVCLSVYPSF